MKVCNKHLPYAALIFECEKCPLCEIEKELDVTYAECEGLREDLARIKYELQEDGFIPDCNQTRK